MIGKSFFLIYIYIILDKFLINILIAIIIYIVISQKKLKKLISNLKQKIYYITSIYLLYTF